MISRPRVLTVTPSLVVSDLQRSMDFYAKLGFVEPDVWGDPPRFAMLQRDGFELMLTLADGRDSVHPHGPTGVWDVYVRVVKIEDEIAALKAAGVTVDKGPADRVYEMREIEVLDPDGHRFCFAQDTSREPGPGAEVWDGVLDVGGKTLRLALTLWTAKTGELRAFLDSPDQGASNLYVDTLTREGGALRFEMKRIGASYAGTLGAEGGTSIGEWSQSGRRLSLTFVRR
jgi:catechol 2,3-dioxygenase-like lactoylglutathione lyase family enzyme